MPQRIRRVRRSTPDGAQDVPAESHVSSHAAREKTKLGQGPRYQSQRRRLKIYNMPATVAMQMSQKIGYVHLD